MKKQFFEKQIIAILHEGEADGAVITEIRHKHNVNNQTFSDGVTIKSINSKLRDEYLNRE